MLDDPSAGDLMTNPPSGLPEEYLTSHMMVKAAGCTYRMLDYWVRCGWIIPHHPACGSGSRVLYHPSQVEMVRFMSTISQLTGAQRMGNNQDRGSHAYRMTKVWAQLSEHPELLNEPELYVTSKGDVDKTPVFGYCITQDQWRP